MSDAVILLHLTAHILITGGQVSEDVVKGKAIIMRNIFILAERVIVVLLTKGN